jgi:hypothetical protein
MPWQERSIMGQRQDFVVLVQQDGLSIAEAADAPALLLDSSPPRRVLPDSPTPRLPDFPTSRLPRLAGVMRL